MVTLVVTMGHGSMDLYSQKLAEHLNVPKVYTNIYQESAELFNISWFSQQAIKSIKMDTEFVRELSRVGDVIHLPNHHMGRYGVFLKTPYVITVHDLIRYFDMIDSGAFIHRPNARDRLYLSLDYKGVAKAHRIIATSRYAKKSLVKYLGIPGSRIDVVYEGVDHSVFKPSRRSRPIDEPYILYVGSEHPRKNLRTLFEAFKKVKESSCFSDLKLVKVGKAGGCEADFRKPTLELVHRLGIEDYVVFVDYVPTDELPAYYSHAECFVLPSICEGFGLTALEAMACGCPVIASNKSALPEVVGDVGILIDPWNVNGFAEAVRRILTDEGLREELSRRGVERAKQFSWQRAAEETLRVYRKVEQELAEGCW